MTRSVICSTVWPLPCHSDWSTREAPLLQQCSRDRCRNYEYLYWLWFNCCLCCRCECRLTYPKSASPKLQTNAFTPSPLHWYRVNCQQLHFLSQLNGPKINASGNIRRFRRICEHIQSMVCAARRAPPASPRVQRRTHRGNEMSESSSCGSDTSERINDRLAPHRQVFTLWPLVLCDPRLVVNLMLLYCEPVFSVNLDVFN